MGTARSEADFEAFYSASSRRLLGHVYAMVGDVAEAEDALQEAYARAWQRWGRVAGYEDPEAWVRTVAYRIAVSSWRRTANGCARTGAGPRLRRSPAPCRTGWR